MLKDALCASQDQHFTQLLIKNVRLTFRSGSTCSEAETDGDFLNLEQLHSKIPKLKFVLKLNSN